MIKCADLITPLLNIALDELRELPMIQCDETRIRVLKRSGKKKLGNSYMWVLMGTRKDGSQIIYYELGPSRAHTVPLKLLEGYTGYLHTDGYEAYETLVSKLPGVILIGDWVHVRRRFDEAVKANSKSQRLIKAAKGLEQINALFKIEREIADLSDSEKFDIRQEKSKPIVENFKKWLDETNSTVPPKSLTGKAISYALNQWPKLSYFLNDPILRLDTNPVENAIRPFVIGRKNWLFSDTEKGARASSALYSLICMAKSHGHNPFEYLKEVFTLLPKAKSLEDIEALLPWNYSKPETPV